jgi:hypothetical protein
MSLESAVDKAIDTASSEIMSEATPADTGTTEATAPAETETTEAETPATETPATDATAAEHDDEPDTLSLSSEDIAKIKGNPELAKAYKLMNKNYTQKTMALAQERQLIDALRNPDTRAEAVRVIATLAGYKLADESPAAAAAAPKTANDLVVDETLKELNKVFDPAVSLALKPVLENVAKNVAQSILEREVGPLREATGALTQQAWREQSAAEVKAFKAVHPDIDDAMENKMAALFPKLPPADDIRPSEYMEFLYRIVKGDVQKAAVAKEVTTRMAAAAAKVEPKGGTQANRVTPAAKGDGKPRSFDSAFDEAFREAYGESGRR